MAYCTLTDIPSWFSCLQSGGIPFTEVVTVVVFVTFFLILKAFPTREALTASAFISTFVAWAFFGMGLINPVAPVAWTIFLAVFALMLFLQNSY